MYKFATILAAVLYQNKVGAMYDPKEEARRAAEADRKALASIQRDRELKATEKVRAQKEMEEAALRSQQDPRLADMIKQRTAYEEAVKGGYNPGISKEDYDKLERSIGSLQGRQSSGFSAATNAVKDPIQAPVAPVAPPVSQQLVPAPKPPTPPATPVTSTVKPPTPPIPG